MDVYKGSHKGKDFLVDQGAKKDLFVNGKKVDFQEFDNKRFYTDLLPYQDFASLEEMAKEIIDNIADI